MMQFNIAGKYLDLYADTSLQFSRKNILLAFDTAEVSRTASFDIPASPKNNDIFQLANDVARDGSLARTKLPAQLQYSGGVENGYLYITGAARDRYTAIFVFGELLGLKELRDAGNLPQIFPYSVPCAYGISMQATQGNARDYGHTYAPMYYKSTNGNAEDMWAMSSSAYTCIRPQPSVRLPYLTDVCLQQLSVNINRQDTNDLLSLYRIIQPEWNDASGSLSYDKAWDNMYFRWALDLKYNLPDMSVVDLLKLEANLLGRALYWNGGVEYVEVDFANWNIQSLDKLIEISDIQRTFANYAQRNRIAFDSAEDVINKVEEVYEIDNTNIIADSDIYRIPLSEGNAITLTDDGTNYFDALLLDDVEGTGGTNVNPPFAPAMSKHTLGYCASPSYWTIPNTCMRQAILPRLDWLDTLCGESTSVQAKFVMSLYEFNTLQEMRLVQAYGQLWVWTAGTWQNGVASLELSKVAL